MSHLLDFKNTSGEEPAAADFSLVFDQLFRKYFFPLCAYYQHKFGLDHQSAKDLVHDGFVKVWEHHRAGASEETLRAYLYKIITNSCLNEIAHNRVKQKHEKIILQFSSVESFENGDLRLLAKEINSAIAQLPNQMRHIFELSRFEGLKYKEISELLDISIKTVETQMSRALLRLRQRLAHYLPVFFILFFFR